MKKAHIIGIVLIAVAIAVIMVAVSDSSTYATFSEARQHPEEVFHVVGKLNKTKPLEYNPEINANRFAFFMSDQKGTESQVVFEGSKPQDFERSEQIVITGKANGGHFEAEKILMKCPSKYNNGQMEASTASASQGS